MAKPEIVDGVPENCVQINCAATHFAKTGKLKLNESGLMVPEEKETEIKQFAVQFKKWPVPRHVVEESMDGLKEAIIDSMEKVGLIKV